MPAQAPAAPAAPAQGQAGQQAAPADPKAAQGQQKPGASADPKANGKSAVADPNAGKSKYVVEGKEYWLSPEQASAYVQKGIAFEPKVSQLDRIQKEVALYEQAWLTSPGKMLSNLAQKAKLSMPEMVQKVLSSNASDDVKEATGKWYWENVAMRHKMDPKDRQILEQDEKIKSLEEADKQKASAAIMAENRTRVVKALGEVSGQIKETLGELGIKNIESPMAIRLTKEIADIMRVSYFSRQPCTAKQAAEKVRERVIAFQGQFYDELEAETLVERLGKANVEKIRKHLLKSVQDAEKGTQQQSSGSRGAIPKRDERKTMNMDDFHDYLDEVKKSGSVPGNK